MALARSLLLQLVAVVVVGVLLLFLAAGFIEAAILVSGWLGLTHALGMDSQATQNYAFSSGTGPMIVASLGFSGAGITVLRHLNCEQKGCWRPGHRHPGHGRPVCRRHYHYDVVPVA